MRRFGVTATKKSRLLARMLWCVAFSVLLIPVAARAAKTEVTCLVTQNSPTSDTITITEAPDTGTKKETGHCPAIGFALASEQDINVLESGIPATIGVSDAVTIHKNGSIDIKSDGDGSGKLIAAIPSADFTVTEGPEGTFGPVTWSIPGKTPGTVNKYVFFSDVAPEPGTMLLFGSGLLLVGGVLRRRLVA